MTLGARTAGRVLLITWTLLAASIASWPFTGTGIGDAATIAALLPLLLPLRGLVRMQARTLQWSSWSLAPALALALTELMVNARARIPATVTLVLALGAFAATIASLRVTPRHG